MRIILIVLGMFMFVASADAQGRWYRDQNGTKQDACRDANGVNRCQ